MNRGNLLCGHMIARSCFQFSVLTLLFASLLACSYETRHVQYALAVRPTNKDEAALLRATVKKFSDAEGFLTKRQAGNEEHLENSGRYLLTFAAADKSFISISNIVNVDCYDVGVHSAVNVAAAKALGERLKQVLHSTISGGIEPESSCR